MTFSRDLSTYSSGGVTFTSWTTATRPSAPVTGQTGYNTTIGVVETYHGTQGWIALSNRFLATGGTETTSGNYKIHTFTTSGTFHVSFGSQLVDYLIVAGGGGAGSDQDIGGGGGAGGLLSANTTVTPQTYTITVGAGGAAGTGADNSGNGTGTNGTQGGNSVALGLTAIGGGYGGTRNASGGSGGSGGGAGDKTAGSPVGGSGTAGQGLAGGDSPALNSNGGWDQGGGGGAGGAASTFTPGIGVASSISGNTVTYAAGGRGLVASTATPNTGNGGSGRRDGASGVVIIRYLLLGS